jgi:hypothetical protein
LKEKEVWFLGKSLQQCKALVGMWTQLTDLSKMMKCRGPEFNWGHADFQSAKGTFS